MTPAYLYCLLAKSAQGGIQGRAIIGKGALQRTSSLEFEGYSNKPMYSDDLKAFGKKCCYFWFYSDV